MTNEMLKSLFETYDDENAKFEKGNKLEELELARHLLKLQNL